MRQAYGREGLRRAAAIGHDQSASRSHGDADLASTGCVAGRYCSTPLPLTAARWLRRRMTEVEACLRVVAFGPSSPVCVHAVRSDETLTEGTGAVAYLMTHFWPGGTEEQYQSMLAVVHPAEG